MKKVLIITYYWPPSGGAGVQRWLKFVKYLQNFNWEPIVYTAENPEMPVKDASLLRDIPNNIKIIKRKIWEPYHLYKWLSGKKGENINAAFLNENGKKSRMAKLSVWIRGNFFIPDARKFWIKPSVRLLSRIIEKEKIDTLISTGPPHSMHLIALKLKKKFPRIKWAADFRDPWTNIDFYNDLMLLSSSDKKHKLLEQSVLANCDAVISIGSSLTEELIALNKNQTPEKFFTITNGYDEEDLPKKQVIKDTSFSIAHIGTLVKSRNPEKLWEALLELINEHSEIKSKLILKLVGKVDISVMESIKKYGLIEYVTKINYLPHSEVMEVQQQSRVNLLLVNQTPNAKGILTGKFFEYLSAQTPILAIGPPDGDLARILKETSSGFICDFNEKEKMKSTLLQLFNNVSLTPNKSAIEEYSRKNLTKKLAEVLNSMHH